MRAILSTMGTIASIELPDRPDGDTFVDSLRALFDEAESRFSLYRPDSELSRVSTGELALADASDELREAYAIAMDWHLQTAGAFTPNRPDGVVDLNGVVKAMSIARAGVLLDAAGVGDWSINVGGDILTSGRPSTVGVVDPNDRAALLASVPLGATRRAIATSGTAERGDHIWRSDGVSTGEFIQATVVADDILLADVLATAIVAGGREMLDRATERWSIDVLAVAADGTLLATPGFRRQAESEWAG